MYKSVSNSFRRFFSSKILPSNLPQCLSTRVSSLANGFRIATDSSLPASLPSATADLSTSLQNHTATVGIWIDAGSRFENEQTNGVAHFLEHLIFKGTPSRSKSQLELSFENMGGHLNAYTSREQTVYYAKVFKKDIPKAVEILADILQHSTIDPQAIESERSVILREMEEVNKNMEEVVFDHLHAVAYQGTSLGRTILGPPQNVLSLQQAHIRDYVNINYTGPRMILIGTGAVEHEELERLGEKHFHSLSSVHSTSNQLIEPARYIGSDVLMRDDTMTEAHVAIAVEGVPWNSPDYWPLLVAQSVVGSWDRSLAGGPHMASKLAQVVSQKGLAQSFMSFNTSYTDTGLFGIYFVSDRKYNLDDMVYAIQNEWVRLCLAVTEDEVKRAKNQLKTNLLLSLDGSTAIAEDIGRQMLTLGKRVDLGATLELIDSVDAKRVREVASEYLYDRCPVVAAFGPIESLPDYNEIRASTSWLRN